MEKTDRFDELISKENLEIYREKLNVVRKITDDDEKNKAMDLLRLEILDQEEMGFPSANWFSDHLPIGAVFTLIQQ